MDLFKVWLEDRFSTGLPGHHTGTITEGVAGSVSFPSPLTRIPRVMLEGGLFCVKGRATQVTGVIIARQPNITSPVKQISDWLYVSGFEKRAHFVPRPNFVLLIMHNFKVVTATDLKYSSIIALHLL